MKEQLTLITGNKGKVAEFSRLLGHELAHQSLEIEEIQHTNPAIVAGHKAVEAYRQLGKPVLVDDTGLHILAWGRLPGALITHYLENMGVDNIIEALSPFEDKSGQAVTALGYCDENGFQIFTGKQYGTISNTPHGRNGFGFDTIFIPVNQPNGNDKTFAEMDDVEKDLFSPRAFAIQALKEQIKL